MAESKSFASPIDNVRRDNKDGAYHCPQCDTPFTRRSNLRRHFQIHMRSSVLKCGDCGEEYATRCDFTLRLTWRPFRIDSHCREDFQTHSLTCYSSIAWNNPAERDFRMMQRSYLKNDPSCSPEILAPSPRAPTSGYIDEAAYPPTPPNYFTNFDSQDPRYLSNQNPSAFSPTMSHLSSSNSVVNPNSLLPSSFDGNFATPSSPPNTFSHRRPSVSSSISSSSTPSSPYALALTQTQGTYYGSYAGGRPDTSWHVPPVPLANTMEEPVYTRRQVKDMIDVVSECLIDTMENVLTRPQDSPHQEYGNGQLIHSIRDDGFRQTVLSEAIPRAYYRIQSGNKPKV
ncbi:hypothetical protein CVT25_013171 [Psilocybe cyanescens]|uniref:C2H2-type domain-containing protein n=1 Tax=Psilocybe cyanescens TaxID=93625 RepID=A0A409XCP6_PSICY|nr:hypothetical protein CVT25_013171 [Psilocybe cyanescens]